MGLAAAEFPHEEPSEAEQPVTPAERLVALDFIRGIAVLGILAANITAFGHDFTAYSWPGALPAPRRWSDDAMWLVQFLLIDGKMRGLFSLLFGAGMVLFLDRIWAAGGSAGLQVRRLVILGLFGAAHFFFLFHGDILFSYAVGGLVVLPFVPLPAERLLRIGLVWYAMGALMLALFTVQGMAFEQWPALQLSDPAGWAEIAASWDAQRTANAADAAAFGGGSYGAVVRHMLGDNAGELVQNALFPFFESIPLMLLGAGLYRAGLFDGSLASPRLSRWSWLGIAGGTLATLALALWPLLEGFPPLTTRFVFLGASPLPRLPVILGLAALLAGWAPRAARGWLGRRLVAAGRMAFSNYLGTSLVMLFVFQGWALGLFGRLHRLELFGIVIAGWALMLLWSAPWLGRFRYGPLEWLWRCLTYGRRFPILREKEQ